MKSNVRAPAAPELSRSRKWLFRLFAFFLLPALTLAVAEVSLRVAGYGYDTRFFKHLTIRGTDYLVENDKFGLRFFPPELARSPAPTKMEAKKPPGVFRIFVLGESAALGDPRPAYGAARYLQALLEERFPNTKFEVICGAVTAINSHAVLPIAQECARLDGDLWILYMGNNEMIGPFGATTVFGSQSPPLAYVRFILTLQKTRLGQWLVALGRRLVGEQVHRSSWAGMKMFLANQIAAEDKRKQVVYSSFEKNLEAVLRTAHRAGVPTILSTVAVNLKDCPPLASPVDTNIAPAMRAVYDASLAAGLRAEADGNDAEAARQYEKASEAAPFSAELHFRLGSSLLAQTNSLRALQEFEKARDYDALPFRADSQINTIVRQTAAKNQDPLLVLNDVVSLIASNSPGGIAGKEFFYEHVHFNFDGNYRVARSWAEQVVRFLPAAMTNRATADWASQDTCEHRLGLTDWNRFSVLEDMQGRLAQPPFSAQDGHKKRMETIRDSLRELRTRMNLTNAPAARELYQAALRTDPDDFRLHENFAEFLELTGNLTNAVTEWKTVSDLIPQHHLAYFQTGRLCRRMAKLDEATLWLRKALDLRPDLSEGWFELGNIQTLQGHPSDALTDYARAQALTPQDYRVYYHTGKALAKLHRGPEAIENFRQALKFYPGDWEARYALGEELAFAGQHVEARHEFEQVIKEKPGYALAHFNLGVALVRLGDTTGALAQFEETLRLDPGNQTVAGYIEKLRRPSTRN